MIVPAGEVQFNRGSIEDHLPHTCQILRRAQIDTNPYDEPVYGNYTVVSQEPCRFWVQTGGERTDERRTVLAYEYRLKVAATTDITEQDIVDNITNQLGEPMHMVQMRITAVWKRTHEIVCVLEKVR